VGEDHRIALFGESAHLTGEPGGVLGAEGGSGRGRECGELDWLHGGFCLMIENRAEAA
jgi:hypothetical protein